MVISFSDGRIFRKCQRQWCFRTLAHWNAKTPTRREMHLLKQLQSVSAWRGELVDRVISTTLVPAWNKKIPFTLEQALSSARWLFNTQVEFARKNRFREPGMSQTKAKQSYAAFFDVEYNGGVSKEAIAQAWCEIEQALTNLFKMHSLFHSLKQSRRIIAQRPIVFDCAEIRVRAVPDLIVFYDNCKPLIVDWKVHLQGMRDYRLQLAIYALALTQCKPHIDFPPLDGLKPTDIRLAEAQLLTGRLRRYTLSEEDLLEVESYICQTATDMQLALDGEMRGELDPFDFPASPYAEACAVCPFRSLSWEEFV